MTPERSVRLARVVRVVAICHGGVRNDNELVQLCPDSALRSGTASSFSPECRGLSDLIGPNPEHETNHGEVALSPKSLIGRRVSPRPGRPIRFRELTLECLMSLRDAAALAIWSKQINPHAP
jgi:hypothetical protein